MSLILPSSYLEGALSEVHVLEGGGQSIHQLEEDIVVRIDFDSHDALWVETVGGNGKQFQPGDEVFGFIAGAGWGGLSDTFFKSIANNFGVFWVLEVFII